MVRRNKYNAVKTQLDGYTFDSKAEARYYKELKLMQQAKLISELVVHPKYPIIYDGDKVCVVELDFEYMDAKLNKVIFIDVKGHYTAMSRLKHKLFEAFYGSPVKIVRMR